MNSTDILFSIVVPIYNVEMFLEQCINSIIAQTYDHFELILVDDGSTDNSAKMCDLYQEKDARVRVVHKKNGGLVSARKAGIAVAQGDYAVCVDSDDWIDENHLLELKKVIDKYKPDVICFDHFEVNHGEAATRSIPFRRGIYTKDDIVREVYPHLIRDRKGNAFPPAIWAKAFAMDLYRLEQLSVDDRIKIGEDASCIIPCIAKANSIYILDKALYYYRRNNISMTKVKKPISWDGPDLIETHLWNRLQNPDEDMQNQIRRRTIQSLFNVIKTQFYTEEKYAATVAKIKEQLQRPVYTKAIMDSHFVFLSATGVFHFFLKHRIFMPFYVLSKIR